MSNKLPPVAIRITDIADVSPMASNHRRTWLKLVAQQTAAKLEIKFIAGEREHKSDLGCVDINTLLDEMESEALDQLAYVMELKRRLGIQLADEGLKIMKKISDLGLDTPE